LTDLKTKKMKPNFMSRVFTLLSVTIALSLASSQASGQVLTASVQSSAMMNTEVPTNTTAVSEKVLHSFERSFATAKSPIWEVSDKNYIAHFQAEDRQALVAISKNGRILYTILYGTEKHLPAHEKSLVQENFADHVITATQNILQNNTSLWLVTLESKKDIYKVKITDGEVSILEHMTKLK
jgi:hypothetical protein